MVGVLVPAGVASATFSGITATARCDGPQTVIDFSSTSYTTLPEGTNTQIDILFDGTVVYSGAYVQPDNAFSASAPAPDGVAPGDTVAVTSRAVGDWGSGVFPGQESTVDVTIPEDACEVTPPGIGRFTGGGHMVRDGDSRVTLGLTIHCDRLLSNNLEVNWGGNKFHMTEHLVTVACTDDPAIDQKPPAAPLDTLVGVGTGRYNGTDGYTVEFTLVDDGEPGRKDMAALRIYRTDNPAEVVLNIPLRLMSGGNLQAHYDQPHR